VFFLDDEDRALVVRRRGEHMKLGFALQLATVRWLGTFLEDPLEVPGAVLDFVAGQLGISNPSQVKRYTERTKTRFDHQWEIRGVYGLKEFTDVQTEFADWVAARSWTSGDGPKAIFTDGVVWLRERKVLLPGVTTLARLVAKVCDDTTRRLWGVLEGLLTTGQRYVRCWRSRRGRGSPILSGGARGRRRVGAARRSSRRWTRSRRSWRWGWRGSAPRRWFRRGGWASWPSTG
jgi:hypothetical protein